MARVSPHRAGGTIAWVLSMALHLAALAALCATAKTCSQQAAGGAAGNGVFLLVPTAGYSPPSFLDDHAPHQQSATFAASTTIHATLNPLPDDQQPPVLASLQLPANLPSSAAANFPVSDIAAPRKAMTAGGGRERQAGQPVDAGETQVFGLRGKGSRFVYIFDRSTSMAADQGRPLAAAKRELIASLQHLRAVHQFQIIFYNEQPLVMNLFRGQSPQMVLADEQGQRRAMAFMGSILPDGGTDHMLALTLALRMRPDVIFFLTDADEPQLHQGDLLQIQRMNQGAVINTIEFGVGPPQPRYNFLQQLADENAGQHTYVDVTQLPR